VNIARSSSSITLAHVPVDILGAPWVAPSGSDLANIYLHARYYDPALGIFLSPDPIGADLNTYRYSLGDPVNLSDPSGLDPLNCGGPQQIPCNEDVLVTAWGPRRRPTSSYWLSGPSLIVEGFEDTFWERQQQKVALKEEARENWRTRFGTGNDNRDPKCTANCDGKGTGNTDSGNRAAVEEMRKAQDEAVEKEAWKQIYETHLNCSVPGAGDFNQRFSSNMNAWFNEQKEQYSSLRGFVENTTQDSLKDLLFNPLLARPSIGGEARSWAMGGARLSGTALGIARVGIGSFTFMATKAAEGIGYTIGSMADARGQSWACQ